jgi:hypothetical protein
MTVIPCQCCLSTKSPTWAWRTWGSSRLGFKIRWRVCMECKMVGCERCV